MSDYLQVFEMVVCLVGSKEVALEMYLELEKETSMVVKLDYSTAGSKDE